MVHQIKSKLSDRKKATRKARPQATTSVVFTPDKVSEQRDPICFSFGCGDRQKQEKQRPESSSVPRSVRSAATYVLYSLLLGAVIRTFVYQYQINALTTEMLNAASARKANLERLDVVQGEMAELHTSFAELKDTNNGLRQQKDMSDFMEHQQKKKNVVREEEEEEG